MRNASVAPYPKKKKKIGNGRSTHIYYTFFYIPWCINIIGPVAQKTTVAFAEAKKIIIMRT